jgi:hypothetical protein
VRLQLQIAFPQLLPIKLMQRHCLLEGKQVLITPVAVQGASNLRLRPFASARAVLVGGGNDVARRVVRALANFAGTVFDGNCKFLRSVMALSASIQVPLVLGPGMFPPLKRQLST